jgi:glycosyltransferase involved in cell wall biosynthesis
MKVMLITGSYPPMRCGVGDYTYHLAQALAAHGSVQVAVLTSAAASSSSPDSRVTILPVARTWRWRELPRILSAIRVWRPDVVHIQYPTQGFGSSVVPGFLPPLCRCLGFRVAQTWHEYRRTVTVRALIWLVTQIFWAGGVVVVRPKYVETMPLILRAALQKKILMFIPNASVIPRMKLSSAEREGLRAKYAPPDSRLIVYFGFMYPSKGVELLFEIADPSRHCLVLVGDMRDDDAYHNSIMSHVNSSRWRGKAAVAGFLSAEEVARVIAAADAVILPFIAGGGEWNTSIHGAQNQGTFVITTSTERHGYDAELNTYFAKPGDVGDMQDALSKYIAVRSPVGGPSTLPSWESISSDHLTLYTAMAAI